MKGKVVSMWLPVRITLLLALSLVVAACGSGSSVPDLQSSSQSSPLPTATSAATVQDLQSSPLPTETAALTGADLQNSSQSLPFPTETAVPTLTLESASSVILHTNDNWGETEPCG